MPIESDIHDTAAYRDDHARIRELHRFLSEDIPPSRSSRTPSDTASHGPMAMPVAFAAQSMVLLVATTSCVSKTYAASRVSIRMMNAIRPIAFRVQRLLRHAA